jgi:hypothetical protein
MNNVQFQKPPLSRDFLHCVNIQIFKLVKKRKRHYVIQLLKNITKQIKSQSIDNISESRRNNIINMYSYLTWIIKTDIEEQNLNITVETYYYHIFYILSKIMVEIYMDYYIIKNMLMNSTNNNFSNLPIDLKEKIINLII